MTLVDSIIACPLALDSTSVLVIIVFQMMLLGTRRVEL